MRMYRLLIMILVIVMACFPASAEGEWQCACNQSNTEKICTGCGMDQEALLGDLNAALALMAEGKYADACFALDLLAGYNCGSLESGFPSRRVPYQRSRYRPFGSCSAFVLLHWMSWVRDPV